MNQVGTKQHDWRGINSTYYGVRYVCESCRALYHGHPGQWAAPCPGTRDTHVQRYAVVQMLRGPHCPGHSNVAQDTDEPAQAQAGAGSEGQGEGA